jgi:hypothetical protein
MVCQTIFELYFLFLSTRLINKRSRINFLYVYHFSIGGYDAIQDAASAAGAKGSRQGIRGRCKASMTTNNLRDKINKCTKKMTVHTYVPVGYVAGLSSKRDQSANSMIGCLFGTAL